MFAKYIIRLDDACPTMHRESWERMDELLSKYNIHPVVAVIPNCKDLKLQIDAPDIKFWEKVRRWQSAGWDIALHGNTHEYVTTNPGLVPLSNKSEFSGQTLQEQRAKIKSAMETFARENVDTKVWIAPSHSFDKNTMKAIAMESNIEIISDGIAVSPFRKDGFIWVPQQVWRFRSMPLGCWTGCFHPNTMVSRDFEMLEKFIKKHQKKFVRITDYRTCQSSFGFMDYLFGRIFWTLKRFKN